MSDGFSGVSVGSDKGGDSLGSNRIDGMVGLSTDQQSVENGSTGKDRRSSDQYELFGTEDEGGIRAPGRTDGGLYQPDISEDRRAKRVDTPTIFANRRYDDYKGRSSSSRESISAWKTRFRRLLNLLNILLILIGCLIGTFVIFKMVVDYSNPSVVFLNIPLIEETAPGQNILLHLPIIVNRQCEVIVHRKLQSIDGSYYPLSTARYNLSNRLGFSEVTINLPIPDNLPPGTWYYQPGIQCVSLLHPTRVYESRLAEIVVR